MNHKESFFLHSGSIITKSARGEVMCSREFTAPRCVFVKSGGPGPEGGHADPNTGVWSDSQATLHHSSPSEDCGNVAQHHPEPQPHIAHQRPHPGSGFISSWLTSVQACLLLNVNVPRGFPGSLNEDSSFEDLTEESRKLAWSNMGRLTPASRHKIHKEYVSSAHPA